MSAAAMPDEDAARSGEPFERADGSEEADADAEPVDLVEYHDGKTSNPPRPRSRQLTDTEITPPELAAPRRLGIPIPPAIPGLAAAIHARDAAARNLAALMSPPDGQVADPVKVRAAEDIHAARWRRVAEMQAPPSAPTDPQPTPIAGVTGYTRDGIEVDMMEHHAGRNILSPFDLARAGRRAAHPARPVPPTDCYNQPITIDPAAASFAPPPAQTAADAQARGHAPRPPGAYGAGRCGCGQVATWLYNLKTKAAIEQTDPESDPTMPYCGKHGPNTPPPDYAAAMHPARPAFSSDEQAVAWERFRAATEQLAAAERAHQERAAALHAAVLAPAQAEYRNALQALNTSIVAEVRP